MVEGGPINLDDEALTAANICAETRLATDFLNHFNEPAMLLDMLDDMPEAAEDILDWRPMTYVEHFEHSGFRDKDLAVSAYNAADPALVMRFENACSNANADMLEVQRLIRASDTSAAIAMSERIYLRIADINDIIVGSKDTSHSGEELETQYAIDALFE